MLISKRMYVAYTLSLDGAVNMVGILRMVSRIWVDAPPRLAPPNTITCVIVKFNVQNQKDPSNYQGKF